MPSQTPNRPRGRPLQASAAADGAASTRDQLLDAASTLFSEKDFDAVSVKEIADRSGVTYSAIYHYFGDKRSLFIASYVRRLEGIAGRLRTQLQTGATPEERIYNFMLEQCRVQAESGNLLLIQRQLIAGDEHAMRAIAAQTAFPEQIDAFVDEIACICGPEQAEERAIDLYATVFGYSALTPIFRTIPRFSQRTDEIARRAQRLLGQVLPERDWKALAESWAAVR